MLKSSNLNSIIDASSAEAQSQSTYTLKVPTTEESVSNYNNNYEQSTSTQNSQMQASQQSTESPSLATLQLSAGMLQIYEPPLLKARVDLKELIAKQNKIYIDLSAEKFKLENAEIAKLQSMINNVKIYKEKLIRIKKNMQNIYQRTKNLKRRAANVQSSKSKELQRKLQKQQQEEALIGRQQQQQQQQRVASTPPTTDMDTAATTGTT